MSKYGIDSKYRESCPVTLIDLCREIQAEEEGSDTDCDKDVEGADHSKYEPDFLRNKFKNSDKSGVIDKLKYKLGFDIEKIAGNNKVQRYDMLRLLKVLYYIEKSGCPKNKLNNDASATRVQITDILAKPSLENIYTDYSGKSTYGEVFHDLYKAIEAMTPNAKECAKHLDEMNIYWECIMEKAFDYVFSDMALDNHEKALNELRRMKRYLHEKVLEKMDGCPPEGIDVIDGVVPAFFNLLNCHKILCNECDRIKINYCVVDEEPPSQDYVRETLELEKCAMDWRLSDAILTRTSMVSDAEKVLNLVTYGRGLAAEDEKHYKYALKHAYIVARWIEKEKGCDFSQYINLTIFVAIIQEIMHIKKKNETVVNDYYGYNNRLKSMMSAVKKPDTADAIIIQAWIRKLENRCAFNVGAADMLKLKRESEFEIFEIKKIIFSYMNFDDIVLADDMISHFAARALMSRDYAMHKNNLLMRELAERLPSEADGITILVPPDAGTVYDCFREIDIDRGDAKKRFIAELTEKIRDVYVNRNTEYRHISCAEFYYRFYTSYGGDKKKEHILRYIVDRDRNVVVLKSFADVMEDNKTKRLEEIGLGRFVKSKI